MVRSYSGSPCQGYFNLFFINSPILQLRALYPGLRVKVILTTLLYNQYVTTPTRLSLETLDSVSNFVKMSQKVLQNFSLAVPIVTWRTTGHSSRTYSLQQLISMSPQKCQLQEFRFPGLQYQLKRQMLKRDRLLIKSKAHG